MQDEQTVTNRNVFVTGGAGFIGSHLVERLLAQGSRVVALDDFNDFYSPAIKRRNVQEALRHAQFRMIEGDLREPGLLDSLFQGETFDVVVHLAARAGVRPSMEDPLLYGDVNFQGTLRVLEACRKSGIPRLVFASSSSVYGNTSRVPFSEADPVDRPISPYAASKRAAELICHTYHHLYGMDIACLRFFTVYGPRQRPEMAISLFTRLIHQGRKISLFGDGGSSRDYTYIDDILEGTLGALSRRHGFEIYNLGESRTVSLAHLVASIEKQLGKRAIVEYLPFHAGDVTHTCADIRKARERLGYRPRIDLEEGLARFVRWYLEQDGSGNGQRQEEKQ